MIVGEMPRTVRSKLRMAQISNWQGHTGPLVECFSVFESASFVTQMSCMLSAFCCICLLFGMFI